MIYAKYGNIFSSSDLTNYYSNFAWYKPSKKVKDSDLTEEEFRKKYLGLLVCKIKNVILPT